MEASTTAYPPRGKAWASAVIVFVLTAIALGDRMAIALLTGPIKGEFGIGDFQAGLLIGFAFTLFYVVFLLPIGAAADKYSRAKVLELTETGATKLRTMRRISEAVFAQVFAGVTERETAALRQGLLKLKKNLGGAAPSAPEKDVQDEREN